MELRIFLDTNVLLKGFAAFRNKRPLPSYVNDPSVKRYTFEKCVFETFMAFRGVGGKKPDEGRGSWAESNLKLETDPLTIGRLASKFHDGDIQLAHYWINQIMEASVGFETIKHSDEINNLVLEKEKFELLCQDFHDFLNTHAITKLFYFEIFDLKKGQRRQVSPGGLDGFARDTSLPSEDFEIVYSAISLPADVFVTDDLRLINCAASLGLNYPLSAWNFCTGADYNKKIQEVIQLRHA